MQFSSSHHFLPVGPNSLFWNILYILPVGWNSKFYTRVKQRVQLHACVVWHCRCIIILYFVLIAIFSPSLHGGCRHGSPLLRVSCYELPDGTQSKVLRFVLHKAPHKMPPFESCIVCTTWALYVRFIGFQFSNFLFWVLIQNESADHFFTSFCTLVSARHWHCAPPRGRDYKILHTANWASLIGVLCATSLLLGGEGGRQPINKWFLSQMLSFLSSFHPLLLPASFLLFRALVMHLNPLS